MIFLDFLEYFVYTLNIFCSIWRKKTLNIAMETTKADILYLSPYFGGETKSNPAQEVPRLEILGF